MLRPERMSRVSVTGSRPVMDEVIETVHDLRLVHLSEYDGAWEGFEPGDPLEGADEASEKLVTVRSLKSILDVDPEEVDTANQVVTDEALEEELEEIRREVNDLDDRRDDLEDDLRDLEERIDAMEPFVDLGIDVDLLSGYDSLAVRVGEGDPESVEAALSGSGIDTYEVFGGDGVAAAFAYADDETLQNALVDATFAELEIPDGEGSPEEFLDELRERKAEVEDELDEVEDELDDIADDVAPFLLAAEEELTIEVQRREAPLSFATTENAFVAEGWIPTPEYDEFVAALHDAVGDHVEISELEQAEYDEDGHVTEREPAGEAGEPEPTAADGGAAEGDDVAADGGTVTIGSDDPPVVQDNPQGVKPFESLVQIINRPKYSELDPTIVLFLTFPLFFGFMIGDLGYGLLYVGLGAWLMRSFDSDIVRSLGGVGVWSGAFTALFGILYGEIFGLHVLGDVLWGGHPPIHKGLQPHYLKYAQAWLLLSVVAGVVHLIVGWVFDFVNNLDHGVLESFSESGSWIMMAGGLWLWVFSTIGRSAKPGFMFEVLASGKGAALPLGFAGFSPTVGWAGLAVAGLGFLIGLYAEGGLVIIESVTQAFGHVVSYTRIAAVLLAKAGMALAVNLLVFGATLHDGEFHFIFFMSEAPKPEHVVFAGMVNGESPVLIAIGALAGIVILLLGHLVVLVLGITSAGLQAVRLEYVEFFGKFYQGGGEQYLPFGQEREYTAD